MFKKLLILWEVLPGGLKLGRSFFFLWNGWYLSLRHGKSSTKPNLVIVLWLKSHIYIRSHGLHRRWFHFSSSNTYIWYYNSKLKSSTFSLHFSSFQRYSCHIRTDKGVVSSTQLMLVDCQRCSPRRSSSRLSCFCYCLAHGVCHQIDFRWIFKTCAQVKHATV